MGHIVERCMGFVNTVYDNNREKSTLKRKVNLQVDKKENNMDAVKFMKEYNRMCKSYFDKYECEGCPLKNNYCFETNFVPENEISYEDVANTVKVWSKRNPEEVGKKYIIEVDLFDDTNGTPLQYHIKGTVTGWVSKKELESFEEYKESEE